MQKYIDKLDWKIKENSNMGYSLQGLNNYISSDTMSEYWLHNIYTEEVREAHEKGAIHIHDLGLLSVYCVGWDLQDLLIQGFNNITKDFDWDSEAVEKIMEMTGKYGIPYFSNFVNSDMSPEDARSMCCHLRLDSRKLKKRGGGLFGANPLTGSVGVVTINLPQVAYGDCGLKSIFSDALKEKVAIAVSSLELKRAFLEEMTSRELYPYAKFYLRGIKEKEGLYWKNHFSTIGIIGMNEACLNFIGEDIASDAGKTFAEDVLSCINGELLKAQERTGNLYNLEATPAEGISYSLPQKDKKNYKNIEIPEYYTNSTQLPVNYTDDIFEVLEHQDELQTKYTGGTVLHVFIGEEVTDTKTLKSFIKKIASNYKLPYFTLTPTFSICPSHGYLKGKQEKCSACGAETEVYSRVVGYLRPVKQWNNGKQAEFQDRKMFNVVGKNKQ